MRRTAAHRPGGPTARSRDGHSPRREFLRAMAGPLVAAPLGLACAPLQALWSPDYLASLSQATSWLNSPPLAAGSLLGKVTAVQFGTFTCINWLRTLPYVRAWSRAYGPALTSICVHTPEFSFEFRPVNVRRAVERLQISHPIAIDNSYAVWRAYDNHYWPALYLLDPNGRLRARYIGERGYDSVGHAIARLLAEAGTAAPVSRPVAEVSSGIEVEADWESLATPEMYLGRRRASNFSAPTRAPLDLNRWTSSGNWNIAPEFRSVSTAPASLHCRFRARDVHLVMGAARPNAGVRFRVLLDGEPPGDAHGLDIESDGFGEVSEHRLYQLVRQPGDIIDRTVQVEFLRPGVEAYAFTFG